MHKIYLHYVQGTPCAIQPLLTLLGDNSFTKFGKEILPETSDLETFKRYIEASFLQFQNK